MEALIEIYLKVDKLVAENKKLKEENKTLKEMIDNNFFKRQVDYMLEKRKALEADNKELKENIKVIREQQEEIDKRRAELKKLKSGNK